MAPGNAPLMPEQLGFEELFGNRRAIRMLAVSALALAFGDEKSVPQQA
jgi:hypothetical protein